MNQKNKRIFTYDAIKCFAIFLVIWGHCIGQLSSCNVADRSVYRIIYSFHMPLFMMISGYFATSSMEMPVFPFLKKKFRQLLYPCLTVGCIIWLFVEISTSFCYKRESFSISALIVDLYWFSDFWFLKSCFICYCLAYCGIRSGFKNEYWIAITLLLSQCIAPFCVSFMYPCFVLGMVLQNNNVLKQRIINNQWIVISLFVIMLFFYSSEAWTKSHGIPHGLQLSDYGAWIEIIFYRMFRLLIGILGALSCYIIFIQLFKESHQCHITHLLAEWGKYTLEVYILQTVILEKIIAHYVKFDNTSPFIYNFVITPLLALLLLTLLIYLTKTIYKMPKLGLFLFGKTSK